MTRRDTPHPYRNSPLGGGACADCKRPPEHPLHIGTLAGMEGCDIDRAQAAAEQLGAELTEELRRPKADISASAGQIERDAPLFFGSGTNPTLF